MSDDFVEGLREPRDQRAEIIRAAFSALAEDMIALGPTVSGNLVVHFKNGLPRNPEWRILGGAANWRIGKVLTEERDS